jgi:hypothetical protein
MNTTNQIIIDKKEAAALAARKHYEKMKNDIEFMNIKRLRAKEYKKKLRDLKNENITTKIEETQQPLIIDSKKRGRPRKY